MKPHDYTVFYGANLVKNSTLAGQIGRKAVVPSNMYPLLVTFTDIADPKSVKQVNPADLAATFGAGFSLKSITLEVTDDKVTEGVVEKVLGWFSDYASHEFRLNGKKCVACPDDNTFAESIGTGNFRVR